MMEDEIHWCWSQCCDLGPHACICGNDCEEDTSMMNKHTPTTEEVRDAFAIRKWDNFQRNYPNSHDKTERDAERQRFDRWHQAELRRAKTISVEQVDAARDSILYDKNRGIEIAIHSPGFDGKSLNDAATELATLAFRAAGLLIEGEG